MHALNQLYDSNANSDDAYLAVRELLARNPVAAAFGPETISKLLHQERLLPRRPSAFEVTVALEALWVEREVLS